MAQKDPTQKIEEYRKFLATFSSEIEKSNDINMLKRNFNNFKLTNNKYCKDFRTYGNLTAYTAANICRPVVKQYLDKLKTFTK